MYYFTTTDSFARIKILNSVKIISVLDYPHFKKEIFRLIFLSVSEKIKRLQQHLLELRTSAANETKSTAGDKFETALAMLQTEQNNTNKQLQALLEQKAILENIPAQQKYNRVCLGCIVQTPDAFFYISIASAKIIVDGHIVYPVSSLSPLAKLLSGCKTGDSKILNGITYIIKKIF